MSSLEEAFTAGAARVLNVKIVLRITNRQFVIWDSRQFALMNIPKELGINDIGKGSFVKLLKPVVDSDKKEISVNTKLKYIKGTTFDDEEDSEEVLSFARIYKETVKTLKNTSNKPGEMVDLVLKICMKSKPKQGPFNSYRNYSGKDTSGDKILFTLFGKNMDLCEFGRCYKLTNLKVSGFKTDDEEWYRLNSVSTTKIEEASSFPFESVSTADHHFTGTILGFQDVQTFEACKACRCKTEDKEKCSKCGALAPGTEKAFFFTVVMEDEDEEMTMFFGFKNVLNGLEITEDVESSLNCLSGKAAEIDYNKQEDRFVIKYMKMD